MADTTNSILQKLDGLEARYEEVSTLITDPSVIADQNRFVKLTKEYKDLGDIMDARKRYIACLNGIRRARNWQPTKNSSRNWKRKSRFCSSRKIQRMPKTCRWKSVQEQEVTKPACLPVTYSICTSASAT